MTLVNILPVSIFLATLYYRAATELNAKRLEDGISIAIYTHYYTMFNHKKPKRSILRLDPNGNGAKKKRVSF